MTPSLKKYFILMFSILYIEIYQMIGIENDLSSDDKGLHSSSVEQPRDKNSENIEFTGRIHNYDSFHNNIPNIDNKTGHKKPISRKEEIEQIFNQALSNPNTGTNIICLEIRNNPELSRYMKNGTCKVKGIMTLEKDQNRRKE